MGENRIASGRQNSPKKVTKRRRQQHWFIKLVKKYSSKNAKYVDYDEEIHKYVKNAICDYSCVLPRATRGIWHWGSIINSNEKSSLIIAIMYIAILLKNGKTDNLDRLKILNVMEKYKLTIEMMNCGDPLDKNLLALLSGNVRRLIKKTGKRQRKKYFYIQLFETDLFPEKSSDQSEEVFL